jgi:NAD+ kinase
MSVRTIGVVARRGLAVEEAAPVLREMASCMRGRGGSILLVQEMAALAAGHPPGTIELAEADEVGRRADAIVVLGGDGTLLAASHLIERDDVPLIGVNFGSLGFLTEITPPELCAVLTRVLAGDYPYEERSLLRAVVRRAAASEFTGDALNDVVVTKAGALSRIIELEARVDGAFVSAFRADGLIVASPTGSTAYSLAAGGPILHPSLGAIVVTPISPHMLTNRPLVLADSATIELRLARQGGEVHVTLDGQRGFPLSHEDTVTVTRSPRRLRLAVSPARDYFEVLRKKLRWGESNSRSSDDNRR